MESEKIKQDPKTLDNTTYYSCYYLPSLIYSEGISVPFCESRRPDPSFDLSNHSERRRTNSLSSLPKSMASFFEIGIFILLFSTLFFQVFLFLTFLENREKIRTDTKREHIPDHLLPSVTIIAPSWNEEKTLAGTVKSLLALDYPADKLQIFLIDDGSTDDTLAVARTFESHPQITVFTKENGGKHTALNLGLTHLKTDLIGCLDADSFVASDALREIVPYFVDKEVMAVTPSVQIHKPANILQRIQSAEYMVGAFTRKLFGILNALYVTPGPFSIYRKEVFEQLGPFKPAHNTEDMEMAMRMQSNHYRIENAHTAVVYTVAPAKVKALYKQRVRWVSGFLKNTVLDYNFMLFRRQYGYLGMLTLPFALISVFIALFFTFLALRSAWLTLHGKYLEYSAVGFHPHFEFKWPHIDWFFWNFDMSRLLTYTLFFTTILLVFFGGKLVTKRFHFSRDMLYFLLFYGLLAPFWLAKSVYNLIRAKQANWR